MASHTCTYKLTLPQDSHKDLVEDCLHTQTHFMKLQLCANVVLNGMKHVVKTKMKCFTTMAFARWSVSSSSLGCVLASGK